jgi:pimeloyl-ACP methyl ester carboxylesterase
VLSYEIYKQNETSDWLVMLHGLGGSSRIWYKQKRDLTKRFNVIFVDLHGHGKSKVNVEQFKNHSFKDLSKDVLKILDENHIESAGFMGVSLGSIIARAISVNSPERVRFMILAGAVLYFNLRCKFLLEIGNILKHTLPYMSLYRLFAWIMMPRKHHSNARSIFVREAAKLGREEFLFWYAIARKIREVHEKVKESALKIPTFYIMGSEDYMFIDSVRKETNHDKHSEVHIIEKSGHLCNIEQPIEFNSSVIRYIEKHFNHKGEW